MRTICMSLLLVTVANAGTVTLPNLISGPIPGNDNAELVSSIVGHPVELVGKFDFGGDGTLFAITTEGIADDLTLEVEEQGLAFFFSSGVIKGTIDGENWDYLAIKSGPNFFLFDRTSSLTAWATDCHFISHASLYRALPEPGGLLLGLFSLIGAIGFLRR